jgi:hypothetical protein
MSFARGSNIQPRGRRASRPLGATGISAVREAQGRPGRLRDVQSGVVIDLLPLVPRRGGLEGDGRSRRRHARPLANTPLVREQLALAINRLKRGDEAEQVLLQLIAERGPSSETYGILRVYKDKGGGRAEIRRIVPRRPRSGSGDRRIFEGFSGGGVAVYRPDCDPNCDPGLNLDDETGVATVERVGQDIIHWIEWVAERPVPVPG